MSAKLICVFVFAYTENRVSYDAAQTVCFRFCEIELVFIDVMCYLVDDEETTCHLTKRSPEKSLTIINVSVYSPEDRMEDWQSC